MSGAIMVVVWRGGGKAAAPSFLALILCCIGLAFLRVSYLPPSVLPTLEPMVGQSYTFTGTITRVPEQREQSTQLYVTTNDTTLLVMADRLVSATYGDEVTVTGKLQHPEAFTTDLGRTFNYPGYLRARGVSYTVSFARITVLSSGHGNPLLAVLNVGKQAFVKHLEMVLLPPQVGLGEGLLLGVKRALGETYETAFRKTGIMHIVVLSGYNVMLVVSFFMFVLAYLLPYRTRLMVGLGGVFCFALLVGLSATVVRASVMAALILIMRFGGQTHHVLRALCLAAVLMLVVNPLLLLFDIGFQLSFLATLALILASPVVLTWFSNVPTIFGMRDFLVATVTTQLFVTPLILYHIGEASLVAVFVNLLVLPVVPLAMLLTFVSGMVALLSPIAALPLAWLTSGVLSYILFVAVTVANIPHASFSVPAFSPLLLVPAYALLFGIWWYVVWYQQRPRAHHYALNLELASWTIETETTGGTAAPVVPIPVFFR